MVLKSVCWHCLIIRNGFRIKRKQREYNGGRGPRPQNWGTEQNAGDSDETATGGHTHDSVE